MQKSLLHIPLTQNENGEPVHNLAHKQLTVCKGAILPACTNMTTRICDEGKNNIGANRCSRNEHCISGRTCSAYGWCTGTSNVVTIDCSNVKICAGSWLPACSSRLTRVCDEGKNSLGSNRCSTNDDCILGRTCSFFGWCSGTQTVTVITCPINTICQGTFMPACTARLTRACDEGKNNLGSNRCKANEDCVLGRSCSSFGWCSGTQTLKVVACARRLGVVAAPNPPTDAKHLSESHLTFCKGAQLPTCTDRTTRICSEESNSWGSGRCNGHEDCMSGRNCNSDGFCQGASNALEIDCTQ